MMIFIELIVMRLVFLVILCAVGVIHVINHDFNVVIGYLRYVLVNDNCPKCLGKKHLLKDGDWIPCECLEKLQLLDQFRQSGVPEEYLERTLHDVKAMTPGSKQVKVKLKEVLSQYFTGDQKDIVLQGEFAAIRFAAALIHKAAVMRVPVGSFIQLDDLVTAFLTQDKSVFKRARDADVLTIIFGGEYIQRVHKYVLNYLVSVRAVPPRRTIWATTVLRSQFQSTYDPADVDFWMRDTPWLEIAPDFQ